MELKEKDSYRIQVGSRLNDDALVSLYSLYQPLVGKDALQVYMTMYAEGTNQKMLETHKRLAYLLNMPVDDIQRACIKLEEYLLLRVYVQETDNGNKYLYEVLAPLSTSAFLSSTIFLKFFVHSFGSKNAEMTISKVQDSSFNTAGYKEITHKMKYIPSTVEEENTEMIQVKPRYHFEEQDESISFDYEAFLAKVDFLTFPVELRTRENLALIGRMATVNGISPDHMVQLVKNSSTFSPAKFSQEKFQALCARCKPDVETANDIYSLPPVSFLQSKQDGVMVSQSDRKILLHLAKEYYFSKEVINVLIEYVLRVSDNRLVLTFVDMVASQWKREGVKTKEDAIAQTKKRKPGTVVQQKSKTPAYWNPKPTRVKEEQASEEEIAEAKEFFKRGGLNHE